MSAGDWLILALVCSAGAISPGPSLLLVLRHATDSAAAGRRCALAHGAGVMAYAALVVSGLSVLLASQPRWFDAISAVGALWMLYLAVRLWQAAAAPLASAEVASVAARDGLMMALLNPKIMLFFVAIFSQFLPAQASLTQQWGMAALAGLIDAGWYLLVATLWQFGGMANRLRARLGQLNRVAAVVFALAAAWLLIKLWL